MFGPWRTEHSHFKSELLVKNQNILRESDCSAPSRNHPWSSRPRARSVMTRCRPRDLWLRRLLQHKAWIYAMKTSTCSGHVSGGTASYWNALSYIPARFKETNNFLIQLKKPRVQIHKIIQRWYLCQCTFHINVQITAGIFNQCIFSNHCKDLLQWSSAQMRLCRG